ncbi:fluoride efflux transporter CrcB [Paracoccus xiamenensis]|uniref:fluoride efflux transporter CrcB n=1 Tax=Paracoccus xiamenensis TaxID=2714901 RepID=UPI00140E71CE|nr:fluoride efflux transporter CrcB [Paracoccus xiamenensis]NHF74788.1 fluoride efflux transporter CrcB [Paracoccus xiamenensis]
MMTNFLLVAAGGAIGASARYGVNLTAARLLGAGFPVATLAVNVVGSFLMGVLAVVLLDRASHLAPFLLTGVLGGFTTFSAFSLDTLALWERGQGGLAAGYVILSVAASLLAVIAGLAIGRSILA